MSPVRFCNPAEHGFWTLALENRSTGCDRQWPCLRFQARPSGAGRLYLELPQTCQRLLFLTVRLVVYGGTLKELLAASCSPKATGQGMRRRREAGAELRLGNSKRWRTGGSVTEAARRPTGCTVPRDGGKPQAALLGTCDGMPVLAWGAQGLEPPFPTGSRLWLLPGGSDRYVFLTRCLRLRATASPRCPGGRWLGGGRPLSRSSCRALGGAEQPRAAGGWELLVACCSSSPEGIRLLARCACSFW